MRTVSYVRNNTVEVQDKPVPEIEADEVLLKVFGAGVCHSDLHLIGMGDDSPLVGSTLGHEVAGVVDKTGEAVNGWNVGLQILAATTGARIIALDTDEKKVEYASSHGANLALPSDSDAADRIMEETDGRGADVVLDFVGVQPTVDLALSVISVGGAVRFVGLGGGEFTYSAASSSLPWGVNIERAYGGTRADMRQAVALVQQGKLHLETTQYPLDDAPQAFDDLRDGKVSGRIVLVP